MLNFGLHAGLLGDLITTSLEYFIRDSKDVLLAPPTLGTLGTATIPDTNVGEIESKGFEIQVGCSNHCGEVDVSLRGDACVMQNKMKQLIAEHGGYRTS